ncbi:uroporphyrinogen decarboxylase family protein [Thermodesulfobacteriota bacterium]
MADSPEYLARSKRAEDALELRKPDRIPIYLVLGYLLAEMGNITRQELHENPEKAQEILEELAQYFKPDMISGVMGNPAVSKILGDRMTKWPGYGLGPDGSFQFDEKEFMKAEDYDDFLEDPSDYAIRTYLPRAFEAFEGFRKLPPLGMWLFGFYNLSSLASLNTPPLLEAFKKIQEACQVLTAQMPQAMSSIQRMAELGFPPPSFMAGALIEAPFDFMSDTLRGMRGIFLDMMRQPEKLLAAEEKAKRIQFKQAMTGAQATGIYKAGIPLHRGSDGFMSIPQFEKFYWPQFRDLVMELIDEGFTLWIFFEGVWDKRLEYLAEFPKGKITGLFQSSDIYKVKEVLGDTMCIMGGMPVSMLSGSSVQEIREYTHKLCERVGKGGGYIMTTGTLELEGCNPELVKAWVDATKEYGVY